MASNTQQIAEKIAEILIPSSLSPNNTCTALANTTSINNTTTDITKIAGNRSDEDSRTELAALNAKFIEAEAIRRVNERNRRDDLRTMEERARLRVESEFRSGSRSRSRSRSHSGGRSRRRSSGKDKNGLVIVAEERPVRGLERCTLCGNLGHFSAECGFVEVVNFDSSVSSSGSSSRYYYQPRRTVRYIPGF